MQTNLAMQVTTAPAAPTGTQARAQPTPPDVTAATDPSHFSTIALSTFNAADAVMYAAYSDAEDAIDEAQLALDATGTSPSTAAAAVGAIIAVDAAAAATEAVAAFDAAADARAPTVIDYIPHRRPGTLSQ